ncbi:MAG: ABC transporter ATP-binding protein [Deltaproteobacteria bacterium]|nr:ABC transporter ATP-binding protein [Candidatus Tharpella aukensis]
MKESCNGNVVKVAGLSKSYKLYDSSKDRLKEALHPFKKKYYKEFYALRDVSFELPKGQVYGIIGFNGSGKSTLLKIICGVTKPTSGEVEVWGRVSALLELGAGFNPEFTGRQNVFFSGILAGFSRSEMKLRYNDIIAFADIGDFVEQPVKSYSSGMVMRLAFSVAIHIDPDILVIDEALAVGDAKFRHKCMARIRVIKDKCTILFVSHDMSAILSLCDRALWLDRGKLVMSGEPKEIARLYTEATYEGTEKVFDRQAEPERETLTTEISKLASESTLPEEASVDSFGTGKAKIISSRLVGVNGEIKKNVFCGDQLSLIFSLQLKEGLKHPIVGFGVADRLGLMVMGFHDLISSEPELELFIPGNVIEVKYSFVWPDLNSGTYAFTVAIADGILEDHKQEHWIHEAFVVNCIREKPLHGMFGMEYSLDLHQTLKE